MEDRFPELGSRLLVLYDGRCGLCNRSVRWFLRHDARDRLRFIPSESPRVAALLARHGFTSPDLSNGPATILAVRNPGAPSDGSMSLGWNPGDSGEQVLVRSPAILAMLRELPGPWPSLAALFRLIPRPIRDLGYRFIARIRYRIWGRYDTCPLPTPAERARFL